MAVPMVGVLSSAAMFGAAPRASDGLALVFIAAAIATATATAISVRSDNARS